MMDRSVRVTALRMRANFAAYYAGRRRAHVRHSYLRTHGEHAPNALGLSLATAVQYARSIVRACDLDLTCTFEESTIPWEDTCDVDCPKPRYVVDAIVCAPDGTCLASLGCIGVDSMRDPYLQSVEAELYAEALATIDAENDRIASERAAEMSERATYAMGGA